MRKPVTIYGLQCPTCGDIRYVGQTCRPLSERLRKHYTHPLGSRMKAWLDSLTAAGLVPMVIVLANADCQNDGYQKERDWIASLSVVYGSSLLNQTQRGDYVSISDVRFAHVRFLREQRWAAWNARRPAREAAAIAREAERRSRMLTMNGETLNLAGWAKRLGISRERVRQRVEKCRKHGIAISEALTTPAGETMPSFAGRNHWSQSKAS